MSAQNTQIAPASTKHIYQKKRGQRCKEVEQSRSLVFSCSRVQCICLFDTAPNRPWNLNVTGQDAQCNSTRRIVTVTWMVSVQLESLYTD